MTVTPLVTANELAAAVPAAAALSSDQQTALASMATSALNRATGRVLGSTTHNEIHAPDSTRKLYLKQYPVSALASLVTSGVNGLTALNAGAGNQVATAALVTSGEEDAVSASGLALSSTASGVVTAPAALTFAAYPTLGALADAVNALGNGWTAAVPDGFALWPSSALVPDVGARGAKTAPGAQFTLFGETIGQYEIEPRTGVIDLHRVFAQGFRYPDRTWLGTTRAGSVLASYTAGYVVVPDDLKRACYLMAKAALDRTNLSGVMLIERWDDYEYQLPSAFLGLVEMTKDLWSPYRRRRLA